MYNPHVYVHGQTDRQTDRRTERGREGAGREGGRERDIHTHTHSRNRERQGRDNIDHAYARQKNTDNQKKDVRPPEWTESTLPTAYV